MNHIVSILVLVYCAWYSWDYPGRRGLTRFIDFRIYYHAARGEFSWAPESYDPSSSMLGWIYPHWTAVAWKPFTWISEELAALLWHVLELVCLIFVFNQLSECNYAWIIILAAAKPLAVALWTGNVSIVLVALCFSPWGALLGSVLKPYLLGIFALEVGAAPLRDWIEAIP
jgi:hypothetical protein